MKWRWKILGRIAGWHLYMAVAPWTLPVVGGIIVSANLGNNLSVFWIAMGILLILAGAVPLGLKELFLTHVRSLEDEIDAQERRCLRLIADQLSKIPVSDNLNFAARETLRDNALEQIIDKLTSDIYSNREGMRAVFYGLGKIDDQWAFNPTHKSGRGSAPKKHIRDSVRFAEMLDLLNGQNQTHTNHQIEGRSYKCFVSASVKHHNQLYGLLTLDTNQDFPFDARDELNLKLLANLIATFFAATERKQHRKWTTLDGMKFWK